MTGWDSPMKQLSETPGEPAEVGAPKIVFKLLNAASTACERLSKPDDEEALHDFRVSVRRLRTFLKSYQPYLATRPTRKAGKRLAGLMKRTNTGRDDQVHVQWLREQLARQRISKTERAGVEMMLREIEQKPEQINGDTINKIADVSKSRYIVKFVVYHISGKSEDGAGTKLAFY